jgi:hypothetical protein
MKYALLIYDAPEAWQGLSPDEQKSVFDEYFAISNSPGVYGGAQLQPADTATTVRDGKGETLVTDGPFAEAKEFFGGFFLLEADDLDTALEVAARIPATRMGGAVEVRPLVDN